ncbi:hypothetical protein LSUE1_G000293 [Lachnellula suecica]|uniref:Uncharacterized protein n=1 Tax=Lachnellula suecica TaxID=602035 RepID=A0A8T9CHQ6_9HELO|nr:hypothetical protein LSUE1_G000293 [Lachnellula suecica]
MEVLQDMSLPKPDVGVQAFHLYNEADPYLRPILSSLNALYAQLYPALLPLLNRAAVFTHDSPALVTVGILLLFLLISVQILAFVKRMLMWWFRMVVRVVFYGLLAVLVAVVWQRGLGRTVEDLVQWGGHLGEVWWREYRRWEGYQNQAAASQMKGTKAGSGWR